MCEADIELVLKERITGNGTGLSIAWQNQAHNGTMPFLQVDLVRVARTDPTIAGSKTISQGRIVATVVRETGESTQTGTRQAEVIAELFPFPLRLPIDGGHIQITKPPDVREGYRQDNQWRVMVVIDYRAFY